MIRQLRRKFVAINMVLVSVVLAVMFGVLLASTWQQQRQQTMRLLEQAVQQQPGDHPAKPSISRTQPGDAPADGPDSPAGLSTAASFWVETDEDGSITASDVQQVEIDADTLNAITAEVVAAGLDEGTLQNPDLRYIVRHTGSGLRIAFADCSGELRAVRQLGLRLALAGLAALAAFLGISIWLARMTVRPVAKAWEQQRQFVADASHELKTPLTVMLTSASLIAAHPQSTVASQAKWLNAIRDEGAEMKQLIDDLLFLAKNDAARAPLVPSAVDFSNAVQGAALTMESVAFEHGIDLQTEITPGLTVQGDAASLHRLAVILLDNAIKYAGTGGTVTLRLAAAGSQAVLTVHNTGMPIPPDRLPHIFERFYRADPSRTGSGTGLGLAIAQSICQAHHAAIRAESGQDGTTFRVEIRKEQGEHHGN